jgi:DNA-binding LacI/PurR family transcriptional regulator
MAVVGSVAALRLLDLIGGRLPDEPVTLLPTELVVRNSCGCGRSSA